MDPEHSDSPAREHPNVDAMRDLNVLWTQSHGLVLSYIRSIIVDFHKADDVLQETAATVAEKFSEYDRSRPFSAWALGVAKYKVLEALRSIRRDKLVFDEEVAQALALGFVDIQPQFNSTQVALEHCLGRVEGKAKLLIERRYRDDLSADEVAEATGMTASAVRVSLHRIRKSLLQCIQAYKSSHPNTSSATWH